MQTFAAKDQGQACIVVGTRRRMVKAHKPVAGPQMRIVEKISPIEDRRGRHACGLQAMRKRLTRVQAGNLADENVKDNLNIAAPLW